MDISFQIPLHIMLIAYVILEWYCQVKIRLEILLFVLLLLWDDGNGGGGGGGGGGG